MKALLSFVILALNFKQAFGQSNESIPPMGERQTVVTQPATAATSTTQPNESAFSLAIGRLVNDLDRAENYAPVFAKYAGQSYAFAGALGDDSPPTIYLIVPPSKDISDAYHQAVDAINAEADDKIKSLRESRSVQGFEKARHGQTFTPTEEERFKQSIARVESVRADRLRELRFWPPSQRRIEIKLTLKGFAKTGQRLEGTARIDVIAAERKPAAFHSGRVIVGYYADDIQLRVTINPR